MAEKKQAVPAPAGERDKTRPAEPVYTAAEFAAHPELFGCAATPDCVTAALALAGKDRATKAEAERLVAAFMKKEVN